MKKYTQSKQLKTSLGQEWIQGSNHLDCSYIITDITGVVKYFFKCPSQSFYNQEFERDSSILRTKEFVVCFRKPTILFMLYINAIASNCFASSFSDLL